MTVTGATLAEKEEKSRQIDRLTASSLLHGSESLCKLLHYLAEQTLAHPGTAVKEYQIATEVFGRPADFDPRMDSTVRVQTGRLRSKLAEYYAGPGAEDPIVIELPKGSYAVTFHPKPPMIAHPEVAHPEPANSPGRAPLSVAARSAPRGVIVSLVSVCAALILSLGIIAYLATALSSKSNSQVVPPSADATAFRRLWKGFVDTADQPWVVFSNAEFVGRPETGMRYYNAETDTKSPILDHYTGVGEVLGIHELDHVFAVLNHGLRVKRGRLLSMDDAKNNDLIFVGSPSENLSLRDIPSTRDFVFKRLDSPVRKGDLAIVNVHPKGNEPKTFFASPAVPLAEDYSLVALAPGMNPAHWVMLLAGTTTIGTQAAVEYVCRAASIDELLGRLTGNGFAGVVPFEAVLRVKVSRGVPVESELVAIHAR
ncbi:MAG: helix-turn-helix domain-containing protein [Bryobacteraceae bacterium]